MSFHIPGLHRVNPTDPESRPIDFQYITKKEKGRVKGYWDIRLRGESGRRKQTSLKSINRPFLFGGADKSTQLDFNIDGVASDISFSLPNSSNRELLKTCIKHLNDGKPSYTFKDIEEGFGLSEVSFSKIDTDNQDDFNVINPTCHKSGNMLTERFVKEGKVLVYKCSSSDPHNSFIKITDTSNKRLGMIRSCDSDEAKNLISNHFEEDHIEILNALKSGQDSCQSNTTPYCADALTQAFPDKTDSYISLLTRISQMAGHDAYAPNFIQNYTGDKNEGQCLNTEGGKMVRYETTIILSDKSRIKLKANFFDNEEGQYTVTTEDISQEGHELSGLEKKFKGSLWTNAEGGTVEERDYSETHVRFIYPLKEGKVVNFRIYPEMLQKMKKCFSHESEEEEELPAKEQAEDLTVGV